MTDITNRKPGNAIFWAVMAVVVVALVVGVALTRRFGSDPTITASPLIGKSLPEFSAPYLEGPETFDSSELDGEIAVINFWASWCFGCRQEHAALVSVAEAYGPFGVTFVGINYQDRSLDRAIGFLDELGRSDATLYVRDEGSRTALEFGVLGLPETFFVGPDGTILAKVSGPVTALLLEDTINKIRVGEMVGQVTTGEVENIE